MVRNLLNGAAAGLWPWLRCAAPYRAGVDIVMTYGAPRFYAKTGFVPISEADAQAPLPLSRPEGWLGRSLTHRAMAPLKGPSRCVEALNNPLFW